MNLQSSYHPAPKGVSTVHLYASPYTSCMSGFLSISSVLTPRFYLPYQGAPSGQLKRASPSLTLGPLGSECVYPQTWCLAGSGMASDDGMWEFLGLAGFYFLLPGPGALTERAVWVLRGHLTSAPPAQGQPRLPAADEPWHPIDSVKHLGEWTLSSVTLPMPRIPQLNPLSLPNGGAHMSY